MAKKPTRLEAPALFTYALNSLARRACSASEMQRKLQRRAASGSDVDKILTRLTDLGYLNDEKFAHSFAHWRLDNQKLGKRRVSRDLRFRLGPGEEAAELAGRAIEAAYGEVDESKLLKEYLARRFRGRPVQTDRRKIASLYRHLVVAGFSPGTIIPALKKVAKGDIDWLEELPLE